ncbi:MAG: hypothetical protein GY811_28320 [Myxococcales bacterium]|nr:hypothetical protein [Myxococcales bacterium]
MMIRCLLVLVLCASCGDDKSEDSAAALPIANSWNGAGPAALGASIPGRMVPSDPHAGLDLGGAGDPHAGLDMGGASDPHAGLDMTAGELMAPNPDRIVDPNIFVKGTLASTTDIASLIEVGDIVFLSVRPINKATGDILGQPLAVERIDVRTLPVDFYLSAANSMVAGTEFAGDVEVYARVDRDGEASTVEAGDIEGRVRASIPAEGLELSLSSIVK